MKVQWKSPFCFVFDIIQVQTSETDGRMKKGVFDGAQGVRSSRVKVTRDKQGRGINDKFA